MLDTKKNNIKEKIVNYSNDTIIRNTFFLNTTQLLNGLFGIFFWIIIALIYSPESIGIATLLISTMSSITYYSRLGLDISLNRFNYLIKEDPTKTVNTLSLFTGLISGLFSIIGYLVITVIYKKIQQNSGMLILLGVTFFIFTIIWTQELLGDAIFVSLLKSEFVLYRNLFFQLLKLFVVTILFTISLGIYWGWGISLIIVYPTVILFLKKIERRYTFKLQFDIHLIKKISGFSLKIFVANIILKSYSTVIPFIIASQIGIRYVGDFYIAWLLTTLSYMLVTSFGTVILAKSSISKYNKSEIKKGFYLMIVLSLIIAISGTAGGYYLLPILFPNMSPQFKFIFMIYVLGTPFFGFISYFQMIKYYFNKPEISIIMNSLLILLVFLLIGNFHSSLIQLSMAWLLGLIVISLWAIIGIIKEIT